MEKGLSDQPALDSGPRLISSPSGTFVPVGNSGKAQGEIALSSTQRLRFQNEQIPGGKRRR
jgi:hypothetical protein